MLVFRPVDLLLGFIYCVSFYFFSLMLLFTVKIKNSICTIKRRKLVTFELQWHIHRKTWWDVRISLISVLSLTIKLNQTSQPWLQCRPAWNNQWSILSFRHDEFSVLACISPLMLTQKNNVVCCFIWDRQITQQGQKANLSIHSSDFCTASCLISNPVCERSLKAVIYT